jgi:hypothetical protein
MSDPTDKHSPDTAAKKRFVRTRRLLIAIIGLLGALYAAKELTEHWRGTVESLIDYGIERVDYYTPLSLFGEFFRGINDACSAVREELLGAYHECPLATLLPAIFWAALSAPITFFTTSFLNSAIFLGWFGVLCLGGLTRPRAIVGFLIFFPIYGWLTKYLLLGVLWSFGGIVFLFAFIVLSLASWVGGGAALVQCYHIWHGIPRPKDVKGIMRS